MLSRYSHVRMEAKRRALDGTATRGKHAPLGAYLEFRQDRIVQRDYAASTGLGPDDTTRLTATPWLTFAPARVLLGQRRFRLRSRRPSILLL